MLDYTRKKNAENDDLNVWHTTVLSNVAFAGKRVLDVGAGTGRFLEVVRTAGATVFAVDPNPLHADFFQRRNIEHEIGMLRDDVAFEPDIITCFEVIEHVYDPNPLFDAARRLLSKRGGELIVSTPNAFNAMRLLRFATTQTHHDPLLDAVSLGAGAEHIRLYSFRLVRDLLRKHGFSNIRPIGGMPGRRYLSHGIVMRGEIPAAPREV